MKSIYPKWKTLILHSAAKLLGILIHIEGIPHGSTRTYFRKTDVQKNVTFGSTPEKNKSQITYSMFITTACPEVVAAAKASKKWSDDVHFNLALAVVAAPDTKELISLLSAIPNELLPP